jgi:hypothetical protein
LSCANFHVCVDTQVVGIRTSLSHEALTEIGVHVTVDDFRDPILRARLAPLLAPPEVNGNAGNVYTALQRVQSDGKFRFFQGGEAKINGHKHEEHKA